MHPKQQIQEDLKAAMKAGDVQRREALRMLMAAFKQVEVDKRIELSEDDAISILMTEAKRHREAIEESEGAGRADLAEKEKYDLALIEEYLPKQLTPAELEAIVREVVQEVGAASPKDTGKVMKALMPRIKGQADGKAVNAILQEILK